MYYFISGYTAKVAGTEMGVEEPEATFSACFGAAFLVWHPNKYAELLATKMRQHNASAWLINTGYTEGPFGVGRRMSLKHTRAIINAIHAGELDNASYAEESFFGLAIPDACPGVPTELLQPRSTWSNAAEYDDTARKLAGLFANNFDQFKDGSNEEILEIARQIEAAAVVNAG